MGRLKVCSRDVRWMLAWLGMCLLPVLGVALVCWRNDAEALRSGLMHYSPRFLAAALFLAVCAGLPALRDYLGALQGLPPPFRWAALALAVFAVLAAALIPPATHRIYYDEQIYQSIGLNIAYEGEAAMADEAVIRYGEYTCYLGEYNKQPNAWPYLLSLVFRAFGPHEWLAYAANNALFGLAAVAVFCVGWLLFDSARAALFAGLAFVCIPVNLQWANTTAVEVSTAAFAAFAVLAVVMFTRRPATPHLFLATALTAYAVQFRPEALLLLPVCGLLVLLRRPGTLAEPRFWACAALFLALTAAHWCHLYAVRGEDWGSSGMKLGTAFLGENLRVNGLYYLRNERFPVLLSIAALGGLLARRRWRETLPVAVWFLLMAGIFLFFYAGSYQYGADIRFSLVSYAPLAILAGWGLHRGAQVAARAGVPWARVVALLLLAGTFVYFLPQVRAVGDEAWHARADHRFAVEFAELAPEHSMVYSHDPCIFLMHGQSASQMFMLTPDSDLEYLRQRFPGGLYVHYGFWCVIDDPEQGRFCGRILDVFDCEAVASRCEREYEFVLYRVLGRKAAPETAVSPSAP